ncbi:probable aquaporin TIP5-1 [Amaranthus tricolor]|uniref:probable aquaporin TIP5-1 n=1 Tax=Amaranthus tricolor TaxID=29722 RepID=UPI0025852E0B|nr:probable aquaporin TIP5-1 [Amaranthus tricolor]
MARTTFMTHFRQSLTINALRSYIAEFISTFIFVFIAAGSTMSSRKIMPDARSDPSSLVVVAIANAFGLATAVYISGSVSGGHVNPAVTFGRVVGCHIPIPNALFYWISQILGSVMACLILKTFTLDQNVVPHAISENMTGFGASILEGIITFALVYTVYAATDPRHGQLGSIGPLIIGLVVGANVLAAGPFSGGSMNPAYSFGAAAVGGSFKNQAVYWIGPLVGAMLAGLLYDNVVYPPLESDPPRCGQDGSWV